ncbi:hypothetical protein CREGCYN_15490 [Synechococcus sp. M16CYN]
MHKRANGRLSLIKTANALETKKIKNHYCGLNLHTAKILAIIFNLKLIE